MPAVGNLNHLKKLNIPIMKKQTYQVSGMPETKDFQRTTARIYTHAVVVMRDGVGASALNYCGSFQLAQSAVKQHNVEYWNRNGGNITFEIHPVYVIGKTKNTHVTIERLEKSAVVEEVNNTPEETPEVVAEKLPEPVPFSQYQPSNDPIFNQMYTLATRMSQFKDHEEAMAVALVATKKRLPLMRAYDFLQEQVNKMVSWGEVGYVAISLRKDTDLMLMKRQGCTGCKETNEAIAQARKIAGQYLVDTINGKIVGTKLLKNHMKVGGFIRVTRNSNGESFVSEITSFGDTGIEMDGTFFSDESFTKSTKIGMFSYSYEERSAS